VRLGAAPEAARSDNLAAEFLAQGATALPKPRNPMPMVAAAVPPLYFPIIVSPVGPSVCKFAADSSPGAAWARLRGS